MIRHLFNLATVTAFLLTAATCILWSRSYRLSDRVTWTRDSGHTSLRSAQGRVVFALYQADRTGRPDDLRCVLYMATLAAIRVNPVIKPFHRRLRDAGKVAKLTIVACMRKLLSLLNAMIRDDLSWDQLDVVKKLASTH